ncbi:uncharacterized protein LOC106668985 [Cimex lectularius]|uniref:CPR type cuticle protein n=1 Tax=Cimex lectularius TaxID=79782 RepID=A0A8I6RZI1_CIMLE|nr:uncharacterized protein LOC106668985 [Cimex lectularius]
MDGRIVAFICFCIGLVAGEYSERGGGATSFAQVFNRLYEPTEGSQYRTFGGGASFAKDIPVSFPIAAEKKSPFTVKSPLTVPVHVPRAFSVPVAPQVPFAGDRSLSYPVYQPVIPVIQNIGKSPFQHYQPFQHQDGFNQQFHPHLQ